MKKAPVALSPVVDENSVLPKLHRPVVTVIVECMGQIFNNGFYADKVLERALKNNRTLGARDRRLIAESVYEMVRWWRLLNFCAGLKDSLPVTGGASHYWKVFGVWWLFKGGKLPDSPEFSTLDPRKIRQLEIEARDNLAISESIPDWLNDVGFAQLGNKWPDMLYALNQTAPVTLRTNRLKTKKETLHDLLEQEGISTTYSPELPDGLILNERKNVFATKAFREGLFEVQDGASQQVAYMMQIKPGMRVVDACAGAGGKALHIAALLQNKGKIIALDVHEKKLAELRVRNARAGVDVIEAKLIDSSKVIKRLENTADRLLLDVPCTGLGVLRRNPDTKWKLAPERLDHLNLLQADILQSYSRIAKVGGLMVYATCSILPSENQDQIQKFLMAQGDRWTLLEEKKFFPGHHGFDGFYAAVLKRNS
jgi:16S rRNA (cytosine967-C5)-methyltransferase